MRDVLFKFWDSESNEGTKGKIRRLSKNKTTSVDIMSIVYTFVLTCKSYNRNNYM